MKSKLLFVTLTLIFFSLVVGCSSKDMTNESSDGDNQLIKNDNKVNSTDQSQNEMMKPPNLRIYIGEEMITPLLGGYSWSTKDGTIIETDAPSPPQLVKNENPIQVAVDTDIRFEFEEDPVRYEVRIWDDDEGIISTSDKISLSNKGKVIYEIVANWKQGTVVTAILE